MSLTGEICAAGARVAANARHVRIVEEAIELYAAALPAGRRPVLTSTAPASRSARRSC